MPRSALALVALTIALFTGACDDEPEPEIADPTTEATSEPTSEPPTTEPTSEPAASTPETTVREWVMGWNELTASGELGRIEAVSSDACTTCEDLTTPTAQVYRDGGSIKSEGWSIAGLKRQPDFGRSFELAALVDFSAGMTVTSEGAEPTKFEAEKHALTFTVMKDGNRWLVSKIVFLS